MFGHHDNICVATCGSSLHDYQINLLIRAGARRILLAYDKEGATKKEAEECEAKHSTDLVITDLRFDYSTSDMPNQIKNIISVVDVEEVLTKELIEIGLTALLFNFCNELFSDIICII